MAISKYSFQQCHLLGPIGNDILIEQSNAQVLTCGDNQSVYHLSVYSMGKIFSNVTNQLSSKKFNLWNLRACTKKHLSPCKHSCEIFPLEKSISEKLLENNPV